MTTTARRKRAESREGCELRVVDDPASISVQAAQPGPLSAVFDRLHTSAQGLTAEEARRRLAESGPNDPSPAKHDRLFVQVLSLFTNPRVVILLIAAFVEGALGDVTDASIIIVIVRLNVVLNFTQSYRAQTAVKRLQAQVTPTATVLRDARWQEVPGPARCDALKARSRGADLPAPRCQLLVVCLGPLPAQSQLRQFDRDRQAPAAAVAGDE